MRNRPLASKNKILTATHAVLGMIVTMQMVFPTQVALAAPEETVLRPADKSLVMLTGDDLAQAQAEWRAKISEPKKPVAIMYMTLSAYNSVEEQCDASPFATAIGSLTRDGIVAASPNLPIGTRVRFPDHFGDKEFRVEDRMNTRYQNNIDIWMEDYKDAMKFGRRYAKIEIVSWGKGRGKE